MATGLISPIPTTIKSGQSVGDVIPVDGNAVFALQMPAAFDGTVLTALGSVDGVTFYSLHNSDGTEWGE